MPAPARATSLARDLRGLVARQFGERRLEILGLAEIAVDRGEAHIGDVVGGLVMEALASLDQVAYVRFASVYRNFREAKDFGEFVGRIAADGE